MKDNLIKKAYVSAFDIKDKALKDIMIINTKCLVDDKTQRYVYVDNNRLKDELIYYRFYGELPTYNNILNIILPISLSNTNLQKGEDEVFNLMNKYIKYLKLDSYKFELIIGAIMYNNIIHELIENPKIEYKELLQNTKQRIIELSVELEKIEIIKFQMERIKIIQIIDNYIESELEKVKVDNTVTQLLDVMYQIYIEDSECKNEGMNSIKKTISSILGEDYNGSMDNIEFIMSMSEYILKIRCYKINKKLYNQTSDARYLIGLEEGSTKVDPILNQISIISKKFIENVLTVDVQSKSGIYTFRFKKA